jgi:hypothetical protein
MILLHTVHKGRGHGDVYKDACMQPWKTNNLSSGCQYHALTTIYAMDVHTAVSGTVGPIRLSLRSSFVNLIIVDDRTASGINCNWFDARFNCFNATGSTAGNISSEPATTPLSPTHPASSTDCCCCCRFFGLVGNQVLFVVLVLLLL